MNIDEITTELTEKRQQLDKMETQVRKMSKAMAIVLALGGALILGLGIGCLVVWHDFMLTQAIIICVVGAVLLGVAYPIYAMVMKRTLSQIEPLRKQIDDQMEKYGCK
ncbi:hypothetical protein [Agathobacter ruminis]|uniref:Uncharacterized protein n=1 Tax=Agathobacter ruminis TaxID=1712665 RepID=A0A2G3E441_9FIRM|nr:hypothetical protein [Agathobacter ruminis]MDC7301811.1 hypothetical protein [Agathobacter ruminis]PHU38024.1 hypothetical protein CSX02_04935 [Agathobacter ruminis]